MNKKSPARRTEKSSIRLLSAARCTPRDINVEHENKREEGARKRDVQKCNLKGSFLYVATPVRNRRFRRIPIPTRARYFCSILYPDANKCCALNLNWVKTRERNGSLPPLTFFIRCQPKPTIYGEPLGSARQFDTFLFRWSTYIYVCFFTIEA